VPDSTSIECWLKDALVLDIETCQWK